MKKIYLFAIALSFGAYSFGQVAMQNTIPFKTETNKAVTSATQAPNDKVTVLYGPDNFSNASLWSMTGGTPTNWTIGLSASGAGGFPLADLTSTSGAPFALFDSDGVNAVGPQDATLSLIAPINCTGEPNVSIQFENYFRPYSNTAVFVEVSNNGTTWTQYQVHAGIAVNGATANPETTTVNISATAGNQATVYIRFRYTGDWDYGWAIDDVSVQSTDDNDLVAAEGFFGFGTNLIRYSRIPSTQIAAASFSMKAQNVGAVDQTNTVLTADVNGGTFTGTSAPTTVLVGATDSLFTTTQYTPAGIGVPLNVTLSIASDSTDASPVNNSILFAPFEITNSIYALDLHSTTPNTGGGLDNSTTPASAEFEAGNYFDMVANDVALSIDVYVGTGTPAGTAIEGVLYDLTTGSFVQVDRSNVYITTAGDVGTLVNLLLPLTPAVTAGNLYFAAIHTFTEFNYGVSGTGPGNPSASGPTSLIFYPNMTTPATNQNYYTTAIPMIRLNVLGATSIESIESTPISFNVYPNPSTGLFNITLNGSNNVNLTVRNVVGQTVINKTIAVNGQTIETISLADYSKGIYFLTVGNETVKLIVE